MPNIERPEAPKIEDVKVTSYRGIQVAIRPFMPNSNSTIRQNLMDGFNALKNKKKAYEQVLVEHEMMDSGAMPMSDPDHIRFYLDEIIERRMGGYRSGMKVRWDLPEGSFEFDPYNGEVERCSK